MATRGPKPMATEEEYLVAVRARPEGFATASEVANTLGVARQTAHDNLQGLVDKGDLEKKKVGAHAVIWFPPPQSTS